MKEKKKTFLNMTEYVILSLTFKHDTVHCSFLFCGLVLQPSSSLVGVWKLKFCVCQLALY